MPASPLRQASTVELLLVLGLPTIVFLVTWIVTLVRGGDPMALTDGRLIRTLLVEAITTSALLPYLARSGWSPRAVAGVPVLRDLLRGIGVWLLSMAAFALTMVTVHVFAPALAESLRRPQFTGALSPLLVVAAAIVNPLFEEFLWLGYAVPAVASRLGIRVACSISVALRVAVHVYQWSLALVAILPVAVVFTVYYARNRRLWPVLVAHVIADVIALTAQTPSR